MKFNRLRENAGNNAILKIWNSLPETFYTSRKVARWIFSNFSFDLRSRTFMLSTMKSIKPKQFFDRWA